jgi:hypothetical protein
VALLTYTTYDDIRAALGVSSDEIEDATLSLSLYELNLTSEFEDINLSLESDYATVAALSSRTAVQDRFLQATRLFATYAVAYQATTSLPLFSPKDISDGKATVSRYADSPYKEVIKKVEQLYGKYRSKLEAALAANNAESAPSIALRTYMAVSIPDSDPVTGT